MPLFDLKKPLMSPGETVSLAIPFAVASSLIYEVCYFWGLGIGIARAPLSPSDYLTGWTEWSSVGLYFFLGMFVNVIVFGRIENWKSEEELIANSKNPEKLRKLRNGPAKAFIVFAFALGLIFIVVGEVNLVAFLPFIFLSLLAIVIWLAKGSAFEDQLRTSRIQVLIGTLIICGINGFSHGTNVLAHANKSQFATIIEGQNKQVIRIFDQWTLVRLNDERFSWVSNQSELKIDFKPDRNRFVGIYCYYQWHWNKAKPHHCSRYW